MYIQPCHVPNNMSRVPVSKEIAAKQTSVMFLLALLALK